LEILDSTNGFAKWVTERCTEVKPDPIALKSQHNMETEPAVNHIRGFGGPHHARLLAK